MLIDLSMPLTHQMPVYPGDPPVEVETVSRFPEADWQLTRIGLGCHSGTHVDAPRHFLPLGATVDQLLLERFCGPARLVSLPPDADGIIDARSLTASDVGPGECLLLQIGWRPQPGASQPGGSQPGGSQPGEPLAGCPVFAPGSGAHLASLGIRLLALDLPTVEEAGEAPGGMHRTLLGIGLVIVENLAHLDKLAAALDALSAARDESLTGGRSVFRFFAVPLLIPGSEASPVRAFVELDG